MKTVKVPEVNVGRYRYGTIYHAKYGTNEILQGNIKKRLNSELVSVKYHVNPLPET